LIIDFILMKLLIKYVMLLFYEGIEFVLNVKFHVNQDNSSVYLNQV